VRLRNVERAYGARISDLHCRRFATFARELPGSPPTGVWKQDGGWLIALLEHKAEKDGAGAGKRQKKSPPGQCLGRIPAG
jgi:hypothetical protein